MRYVDTSVLIAYMTPESHSKAAEKFMRSKGRPLAISSWTEVELVSALGVKLRTGQLDEAAAHAVLDAYLHRVAPQLGRIAVDDNEHRHAAILLDGWRTGLRAGDALHLAIAASRAATLHTFDQGLAAAGKKLGVAVKLLD